MRRLLSFLILVLGAVLPSCAPRPLQPLEPVGGMSPQSFDAYLVRVSVWAEFGAWGLLETEQVTPGGLRVLAAALEGLQAESIPAGASGVLRELAQELEGWQAAGLRALVLEADALFQARGLWGTVRSGPALGAAAAGIRVAADSAEPLE